MMKPKVLQQLLALMILLVGLLGGSTATTIITTSGDSTPPPLGIAPSLPVAVDGPDYSSQDSPGKQTQIVIIGGGDAGEAIAQAQAEASSSISVDTGPRWLTRAEVREIVCRPEFNWQCAEAVEIVFCEATVPDPSDPTVRKVFTHAIGKLGELGIWQLYLVAHPDITSTTAFNPRLATIEAYRIYTEAGGWGPWLHCSGAKGGLK